MIEALVLTCEINVSLRACGKQCQRAQEDENELFHGNITSQFVFLPKESDGNRPKDFADLPSDDKRSFFIGGGRIAIDEHEIFSSEVIQKSRCRIHG